MKYDKLLWKLQQDFRYEYKRRLDIAKHNNITIKELLDLGFNSNYLSTEFYGNIDLGWKNEDGTYQIDLTNEQLNTKIVMDEDFEYYDDDDYVIARVHCINKEDEKLFKEVK